MTLNNLLNKFYPGDFIKIKYHDGFDEDEIYYGKIQDYDADPDYGESCVEYLTINIDMENGAYLDIMICE